MDTIEINWIFLGLGILILILPIYILWKFNTGIVKDTVISSLRMILQLLLVGFYLEFLFALNNLWINILWIIAMIVIASFTLVNRTGLRISRFLIPNILSLLITLLIVDSFFLGFIIHDSSVFEGRYLIPISGMILGNAMQNSIISLNYFFSEIKDHPALYRFSLGNGARLGESLSYYYKNALMKSLNPSVAKMAVIGLIALPGTMTGQIIGGSSPTTAIKYQILLMLVIFAASALSSWFSLWFSVRYAFDGYGNLKRETFKKVKIKN